jgi:hypothetical protein
VTVLDRIPGLRGTGSHRAVAEVLRLRERERELETALGRAVDRAALLQWDLTLANAHVAEAEMLVVKQQADIFDLTDERDQLAEEVAALRRRFSAQLAADANTHRITVPPMVRPVNGPEDEATTPIEVRPLWDAHGVRPVTDPGHI